MVDSCETGSAIGDSEDTPDEHTGGDSSKSNSTNSEHSLHFVGTSATSSQVFRFAQNQLTIVIIYKVL